MTDDELGNELWTCIGYDPGGMTGWALLSLYPEALNPGYRILDNVVFWTCGEFVGSANEQGRQMALLAAAWPNAVIVVEDFILRTYRMDRVLLEPVRVTQAFETALSALEEAICCGAWAKHKCTNDINLIGTRTRSKALTQEAVERRWKQNLVGDTGLWGYHLQQPSLAMSTMTDERLQIAEQAALRGRAVGAGSGSTGAGGLGGAGLGFYNATRGMPHARDAVRHVLTFARREAQARMRGRSYTLPYGQFRIDNEEPLPD